MSRVIIMHSVYSLQTCWMLFITVFLTILSVNLVSELHGAARHQHLVSNPNLNLLSVFSPFAMVNAFLGKNKCFWF